MEIGQPMRMENLSWLCKHAPSRQVEFPIRADFLQLHVKPLADTRSLGFRVTQGASCSLHCFRFARHGFDLSEKLVED